MNNQNQQRILFMGALIEEHENRNVMRIARQNLRDTMNAFEIPDAHFKQMYRLSKECVYNLIQEIQPFARQNNLPLHLKVLTTLHFVATGSFQNPVGCNSWISLSQTSVSRVINEICTLVTENLFPNWIKFPTNAESKNLVKRGFYEERGGRGVVGVIDGTHVDILAPPIADANHPPFVYINRKGKHSVNVMLISDSNTKIIGCNARFPGSVHDAAIWQTCSIRNHLLMEYENGDKSTHLLGDSGYPLEPWLFTPFAAVQENTPEARFNRQLNTARNIIERTNGILKGRFRCLSRHRVLLYHPIKVAKIVYSYCDFHNIALEAGMPIMEDQIKYRDDDINIGIGNSVH